MRTALWMTTALTLALAGPALAQAPAKPAPGQPAPAAGAPPAAAPKPPEPVWKGPPQAPTAPPPVTAFDQFEEATAELVKASDALEDPAMGAQAVPQAQQALVKARDVLGLVKEPEFKMQVDRMAGMITATQQYLDQARDPKGLQVAAMELARTSSHLDAMQSAYQSALRTNTVTGPAGTQTAAAPSVQSPSEPDPAASQTLEAAQRMLGKPAISVDGKALGTVRDVLVTRVGSAPQSFVLALDGKGGGERKEVLLTWLGSRFDTTKDMVVVGMSADQVRAAPEYDGDTMGNNMVSLRDSGEDGGRRARDAR